MRHRIFPSLLSLSLALGLCVLPAAALETDDLKTLLQTYYVDQVPENGPGPGHGFRPFWTP